MCVYTCVRAYIVYTYSIYERYYYVGIYVTPKS